MYQTNSMLPLGIYDLVKVDKEHALNPTSQSFEVAGKNYGNMDSLADRFWNSFATSRGSVGVLLTGKPGSGKTRMMEVLCNKSLAAGVPVVIVGNIQPTIGTIHYLSMLTGVTVLFDEFGKRFPLHLQGKMLGMLAGTNSGRKLLLMTENSKASISPFILNRPGRARYHIDYDRVGKDVIDEYCDDYNVSSSVYKEIMNTYSGAVTFSFDHLQAIVSEHKAHPGATVEEMLGYLNLSILRKEKQLTVMSIIDITTDENIKFIPPEPVSRSDFLTGRVTIWVNEDNSDTKPGEFRQSSNNHRVSYKDITYIDDSSGEITCVLTATYSIVLEAV